jgi:NAD(P)-dependent dehydrogenase (short-subunit alcohol dehydrogenase family)
VAVVAGADSGIGETIAARFSASGAAVHIANINPQQAQEAAKKIVDAGGRVTVHACDVTNQQQMRETFQRFIANECTRRLSTITCAQIVRAARKKCTKSSPSRNRSEEWENRKKWRRSRCFSVLTKYPSSPALPARWMAASCICGANAWTCGSKEK